MSRSRFLILPILLGMTGDVVGWWTYDVELSAKRRDLATDLLRPHKPVAILGGDFDEAGLPYIYVETTEGNTYSGQRPSDLLILSGCWVQTDSPQIAAEDEGCETNPEDVARHRQFVISEPPGTPTDRIRLKICGASSGVYEYVLLEDGSVWGRWFGPEYPWDVIGIAVCVWIGGCPGISVGLILSSLGRRWLRET